MADSKLIFEDSKRVANWVGSQMLGTATWSNCYAMGVERDGDIVSGIVFDNFNPFNAYVHIAVSKPNKLFLELLDHAFCYAFDFCNLRRLTGIVEADNEKALKLDLNIGFEYEATLREAGASGQDVHLLVLWPNNYRKGRRTWENTTNRPQTTRH